MNKLVCATAVLSIVLSGVVLGAVAVASEDTPIHPDGQFAVGTVDSLYADGSGQLKAFVIVTHESGTWPHYQLLRIDVTDGTEYLINKDSASWRDLKPGDRVVTHLTCGPNGSDSQASLVRIVSQNPPALYCVVYTPPEPMMFPGPGMSYPYGPMGPYHPPYREYSPYGQYPMP